MTFLEIYGIAALVILGYMGVIWIVSLILKNSSIVDIFWGAGFVLSNWVYFALTPDGFPARKWLIGILVTIWGLRLSLYILWRNWGKPEDFRYRKWRDEEGERWWWFSFFKVFLLQGFLMWIISAPLLAAQISPAPAKLTFLDLYGRAGLVHRLLLRGGGRLANGPLQGEPGEQGQGAEHRRVALHSPSQLLWRRGPVVGVLSRRGCCERWLLDDL